MSSMEEYRKVADKIIVALDYPTAEEAREVVQALVGTDSFVKVGMELFYNEGPAMVTVLEALGFKIFLDLKLHDIPNTVRAAAKVITELGGVTMFNVHAAGGKAMMEAAREGMRAGLTPGVKRPLLIAVTQLTSTDKTMMNREIGISGEVVDTAVRYALMAKEAGLDGVVASSMEVRAIKEACGPEFLTIVPGIRPAGAQLGDQVRVMTPPDALAQGADYLVIGRPITRAANPGAAYADIIRSCVEHEHVNE
jgi:orotidine-5'-phosphate decarboxylase